MYKRISHEIVEEHFDHPAVLPTQLTTGANLMYMPRPTVSNGNGTNGSLAITDPLPAYVMTEPTMLFRMDSRTLWSKYAWGLLNFGISLNNKIPGTEAVEARAINNASNIGEIITPYYGVTAGTRVADLLAGVVQIGIDAFKAIKDGERVTTIVLLWDPVINDLVDYLNDLNPNNWPKELLKDYFNNLVKFWIDEATARNAKDIAGAELAIDRINRLVIIGTANSTPSHKSSSLADVFSRGIIAQFPTLFAE